MKNFFATTETTLLLSRLMLFWLFFTGTVWAQSWDPLERTWPVPGPVPADWPEPVMDNQTYVFMQADRLEAGLGEGAASYDWDVQGWIGKDRHKFWMKSEAEGSFDESIETLEVQGLYSRLLTPFWDIQFGARYDISPQPDRGHIVIGLQGLAPYWLEVDAATFISNKGDISFRAELEYDLLFTQRLILQPRFEINAAAQAIPELALGSGIHNTEIGLRLRYEIRREIAPYIGISWNKHHGATASNLRETGESSSEFTFIMGVRLWY